MLHGTPRVMRTGLASSPGRGEGLDTKPSVAHRYYDRGLSVPRDVLVLYALLAGADYGSPLAPQPPGQQLSPETAQRLLHLARAQVNDGSPFAASLVAPVRGNPTPLFAASHIDTWLPAFRENLRSPGYADLLAAVQAKDWPNADALCLYAAPLVSRPDAVLRRFPPWRLTAPDLVELAHEAERLLQWPFDIFEQMIERGAAFRALRRLALRSAIDGFACHRTTPPDARLVGKRDGPSGKADYEVELALRSGPRRVTLRASADLFSLSSLAL